MPMIMTKDHLYQKYSDALNAQYFTHAKLLSLTHFHKMFKGEHRHIKFPWFCVLRQCNICASTNDTLTNWTMSTREQAQLKQWKLDHLKLVEVEQKAYHLHQQEAVADPSATFQENKNKYMLAYCHWLVFNKVF
ncbi:uncharacterized protein ACA1_152660 [Acanthamoeba castellanii str. Neff]|uniref:Uncharacterized protein n=1 Tax=Acanthamoeba castellanii (strain ATCC 30010 / Neff) TaxID=1257118 RepID=L8HFT0_ACACF|nr:uncharacterized protein ACA1_152660 [Acanthamoeba castellanii str. Neff]ELR24087.1 hypothetical protein ACA1_152660 [Acanthamoeba castellanii str. Neff]